jgi:hypothetical protein
VLCAAQPPQGISKQRDPASEDVGRNVVRAPPGGCGASETNNRIDERVDLGEATDLGRHG